jgi:hypothetical protein
MENISDDDVEIGNVVTNVETKQWGEYIMSILCFAMIMIILLVVFYIN